MSNTETKYYCPTKALQAAGIEPSKDVPCLMQNIAPCNSFCQRAGRQLRDTELLTRLLQYGGARPATDSE